VDEIEAIARPEAYVRKMIVNEYISWRRKWARVVPVPEVRLLDVVPDHAVNHAERAALIEDMASLPPKQRAVIVLRYYGGLSDAQIADTLGCGESTVRAYATRALAALRVEIRSNKRFGEDIMMRTEDDVRAACRALEDDAPELADVLGSGRERTRGGHWLRAIMPVAATVVLVAGVAVGLAARPWAGEHHATPTAPSSPAGALSRVDFTMRDVDGYTTVGYDTGALFQRAELTQIGGSLANVTRYRPGAYDGATSGQPSRSAASRVHRGRRSSDVRAVSGDGSVRASSRRRMAVRARRVGHGRGHHRPQHRPDRRGQSEHRPGRGAGDDAGTGSVQARLPAGRTLRRVGVNQTGLLRHHRSGRSVRCGVAQGRHATGITAQQRAVGVGDQHHGVGLPRGLLRRGRVRRARPDVHRRRRPWVLHHDHGATSGLLVDLRGHTVRMLIDAGHYRAYPDSALVHVLEQLAFAPNVNDPGTWFAGDTAVPH